MKIWKRRMALVLALVLLLSTGAMAAGAKYSSWFAPYYKEMQALGILPASFTTGDLTATITRGEMSELAVVAFEKATFRSFSQISTLACAAVILAGSFCFIWRSLLPAFLIY